MNGNKIQLRVRDKKGKGRLYLIETVFSFIYNIFPTYYIKRIRACGMLVKGQEIAS